MPLNMPLRRVIGSSPSLPSTLLSRTTPISNPTSTATTYICNQCRHATLLRRPKRPYTFTQLITLSDGSTFLHRTTSPIPVYRSTRDTRNSLMWNPTSKKLVNLEEDEAGRLAAFRARFGRGYDANAGKETEIEEEITSGKDNNNNNNNKTKGAEQTQAEKEAAEKALAQEEAELQEEEDNLLDLISSFGQEQQQQQTKGKKK